MISFVFLWLRQKSYTDQRYVKHIVQSIRSNTEHECDFVCVTDQASAQDTWDIDGEKVRAFPRISRFQKHQHAKLELFRKDLSLCERAVLTDLDNFVIGSIDDLLEYDGIFGARRTFRPDIRPQPQLSWAQFHAPSCTWLWDEAAKMTNTEMNEYAPTGKGRGDQLFVYRKHGEYDRLDDLYPGQLDSWKWGWLAERSPDARVLFAHGRPKPHDLNWRHDAPFRELSKEAKDHVNKARKRFGKEVMK